MKDPAFLFYPGDYICETMGMSRIERDCFMDLILLQFNHYHFTAHQAENVLKEDFAGVWLNIKERFIQEGEYYFNVSIRTAIAKRKAYVKSRQEIAMSGKKKKKAQPGETRSSLFRIREISEPGKSHEKEEHIPVQKRKHLSPALIMNGIIEIWDQSSEAVKKEFKQAIWDGFFLDKTWITETCKVSGYNAKSFEAALKEFLKDQGATDDIARGMKALKRHFINKFKKRITA